MTTRPRREAKRPTRAAWCALAALVALAQREQSGKLTLPYLPRTPLLNDPRFCVLAPLAPPMRSIRCYQMICVGGAYARPSAACVTKSLFCAPQLDLDCWSYRVSGLIRLAARAGLWVKLGSESITDYRMQAISHEHVVSFRHADRDDPAVIVTREFDVDTN